MKRLLFIINPKAGKTAIRNELFDIILTFADSGYEVVTYPTTGPEDAERKVVADGADYDLIVCAGGDGTLENTVCGYMRMGEKKVPIGYIPVGTTNDFARSMKISRKPIEAAKQIVSGYDNMIDVGRIGDKYFIYIAAFGMFTDISYSTKQSMKKIMGHSAYIIEALKSIVNFKSYKIRADFDGAVVTGEYIYGMITNSFSVAGFKLRGAKHVLLDDGKFDCLLVKKPENATELQQIISAVISNDIEENEMFFECKAAKITFEAEEEIPWTVDGEFGGSMKNAEICNEKQAVNIFYNSSYKNDDAVYDSDEIAAGEYDSIEDNMETIEQAIRENIPFYETSEAEHTADTCVHDQTEEQATAGIETTAENQAKAYEDNKAQGDMNY